MTPGLGKYAEIDSMIADGIEMTGNESEQDKLLI